MADVDENKLRYGLTSKEESQRLREATKFINELPIYMADDDDEDSEP